MRRAWPTAWHTAAGRGAAGVAGQVQPEATRAGCLKAARCNLLCGGQGSTPLAILLNNTFAPVEAR